MPKPVTFTPEVAAALCDRIADGMSLREVCRAEDMPNRDSVRCWLRENETFRAQYDQARIDRTEAQLEEIQDIADDASNDWMNRRRADGTIERVPDPEQVARSKLRIHARQWAMARMQPRRFGDKIAVGGDADAPPVRVEMSAVEIARRVAFLMRRGLTETQDEVRQD